MRVRAAVLTVMLLGLMLGVGYSAPVLEIPETEFNFGRTAQHATVAHTFWLKSTGDEPVEIVKVIPGCGCAKAPLKDSVLAPGDSTELTIIFDTRSYRGMVTKRPYVELADGSRWSVRIHSELLPKPEEAMPISLDPYRLDVSQFTPTPRRMGKFNIVNKGDRDYNLKLIDYGAEFFELDMPTVVKAGQTATGTIMVHEHLIESEFTHSITFELDDEMRTRYTLPVKRMYRARR
jgi:hypothetical protein